MDRLRMFKEAYILVTNRQPETAVMSQKFEDVLKDCSSKLVKQIKNLD